VLSNITFIVTTTSGSGAVERVRLRGDALAAKIADLPDDTASVSILRMGVGEPQFYRNGRGFWTASQLQAYERGLYECDGCCAGDSVLQWCNNAGFADAERANDARDAHRESAASRED